MLGWLTPLVVFFLFFLKHPVVLFPWECAGSVAARLPAVEPVFAGVALDHEAVDIVRLPAHTVQRGRRHLPSVPKHRNEAGAGLKLRWAGTTQGWAGLTEIPER